MRRLTPNKWLVEIQQARIQSHRKRVQIPEIVAHDLADESFVFCAGGGWAEGRADGDGPRVRVAGEGADGWLGGRGKRGWVERT